jgi:hypothetical protein
MMKESAFCFGSGFFLTSIFCCITRSIAPGLQSRASEVSAPTVIVVSGVDTNTSPEVVRTPVAASK